MIDKIEFDLDFDEKVELLQDFIDNRSHLNGITFKQVNKPDFDQLDKEEFFIFMINMLRCHVDLLEWIDDSFTLIELLDETDLTSEEEVDRCLRCFWVRFGEWSNNTAYEW